MHFLHKILVHIPDATDLEMDAPKQDILSEIISHARSETECFCDRAFDWREDDSAGRWSDEYPQQAYLASDDLDWFLKELNDIQTGQKFEINTALQHLRESVGTDLTEIVSKLWDRDGKNYDPAQGITEMTAYYLRVLAQLLYGDYRCDSCFYNTKGYTARLYKSDLDEIKENPENWALVMFDYHY